MRGIILSAAMALGLVLPAAIGGNEASASQEVHPDCIDSLHPHRCTRAVEEIELEAAEMVEAYAAGDIDTIMSFHSSPGLVYKVFDTFHRGAASYEGDLLGPFFAYVGTSIGLDLSDLRCQMITPDVYIQYGVFTETITFNDGFVQATPKRVMITWVRNQGVGDPDRRFVIAANMQEPIVGD